MKVKEPREALISKKILSLQQPMSLYGENSLYFPPANLALLFSVSISVFKLWHHLT